MSNQKVAIVGCNGFIGRHLSSALSKRPEVQLTLFGRSEKPAIHVDHKYHQLNISNKKQLLENFVGTEVLYYLASETIPASSWSNPMLEIEKNLAPFIQLIEIIAPLNIKKIVFLSSAGTVYGTAQEKISEDSEKKPFSPYGIVKLAMENFLEYFRARHGIQYDIYRVSNVYGEGQDTSKGLGIINTFLEKIIHERAVTVFGDGENTRNYIYVDDVVQLLTTSLVNDLKQSGIYNLSSNDTLSINQLIELMKKVVNEPFLTQYLQNRKSDNAFINLDNSKILAQNNNFRFTPIEQGIEKTFLYLKEQPIKI